MTKFFVPGLAVPGGSKRAFPIRGRDGRTHVTVVDTSGRKGIEWRAAIRHAAHVAHARPPLAGALCLGLIFTLPRPQFHRRADGTVKAGAPPYPTTRPDVLKLARAVEDACTSILWGDDAQIVHEYVIKQYTDGTPGVWVIAFPATEEVDAPHRQAVLALAGRTSDG